LFTSGGGEVASPAEEEDRSVGVVETAGLTGAADGDCDGLGEGEAACEEPAEDSRAAVAIPHPPTSVSPPAANSTRRESLRRGTDPPPCPNAPG
jgi:hypothetical protein